MREQYPFFREGDERTAAVIGEEAASSDLEGTYQKPYAILTQKWLYCKNEQGNFIADASTLTTAGKGLLPGQNWFLWAVAACAAVTLALLCFWYWGMNGQYYMNDIYSSAQSTINNYHSMEEKLPEYEQQIRVYEEAQALIDADEQRWTDMGYDKISSELSSIQSQKERLQANISDYRKTIQENELEIRRGNNALERLQEDLEEARKIARDYPTWIGTVTTSRYQELVKRLAEAEDDIQKYPERVSQWRQIISQAETQNTEYQEKITEAQAKLAELKQIERDYSTQVSDMEAIEDRIQSNRATQEGIDYTYIKSEIENHQTMGPVYQEAKSIQQRINLFLPCFIIVAVFALALIALTILKHTKLAVITAWSFAAVEMVCIWLVGSYGIMPLPLLYSSRILPAFAVFLTVPALLKNRKQTVFQVVHATGAFYFTPSLYPAEELAQFAEQIKSMQSGEADGE